jgi:Protein of unknown function (DUF4254)
VSVPALPTAAAILDALADPATRTSGSRPAEEPAEIMELVCTLHRNNTAQWDREDDARRGQSDDAGVAAAKRDIDRLNRARHGFIEAIDRAILVMVAPHEGAPLVTETPGMAIDRLSVLVIRLAATEARAASGIAGARHYADRLPQLRSQLSSLEEAIATLLVDLGNGTRRFLAHETLKLYGPEDSEPVG